MTKSEPSPAVPLCYDHGPCLHLGICGERGSCQRDYYVSRRPSETMAETMAERMEREEADRG